MEPPSMLREFKNVGFGLEEHRYALRKGIRGVEDRQGQLWLYWEDVLRELRLPEDETYRVEELSDGRAVISEGRFYELVLTASPTATSREFLHWICNEVLTKLAQDGHYELSAG